MIIFKQVSNNYFILYFYPLKQFLIVEYLSSFSFQLNIIIDYNCRDLDFQFHAYLLNFLLFLLSKLPKKMQVLIFFIMNLLDHNNRAQLQFLLHLYRLNSFHCFGVTYFFLQIFYLSVSYLLGILINLNFHHHY